MKRFIHFGCWNQGHCDLHDTSNQNPISQVMRKLQQETESHIKPDFIVVAGDNYYPEKTEKTEKTEKNGEDKKKNKKKIKVVQYSNFDSGFQCLPTNTPIDIILGNHDLETNRENVMQLYIDGVLEPNNACSILLKEMELSQLRPNINFVLNKARLFGPHTLVLMIDTSMYDTDDVEYMLPCYQKMLDAPTLTVSELQNYQFHFVMNQLTIHQNIHNIVIIGHHPITGFKSKSNTTQLIYPFPLFVDLLFRGYQSNPSSVFYYLCADLHLFQTGTIIIEKNHETGAQTDFMSVQQYVVGTGGTKLDPNVNFESLPNNNEDVGSYNVKYNMDQSIEEHGFLECSVSSPSNINLNFVFISTTNKANVVGGKKKYKTKKYKTKKYKTKKYKTKKYKTKKYKTKKYKTN